MRIQETLVTDKQITLELFSENGKYRLPIEGKDYYFPTLEKVHEAFLNQDIYDTIKLTYEGKKSYLHLFMDEIEVFDTKKALRQRLSQDSQGMWAEIRNGKTQYYVEERGWTSTSYKEITEQQCLERLTHTSTMTKVLGIGLGMLALFPGALELARRLPIGTKEAAMGLVALNQKSPVLGAVGYSLLPSKAEAQAVGTEFQVNTNTTNDQTNPNIASLNDGGFVVVWQSYAQDGDSSGIYGQRYNSNGTTAGSEFRINTYTTLNQEYPSIAPLNDGGFVVTWQSFRQDGDYWGIYGQRYNNNGSPASSEFQINTYTTGYQERPSVAHRSDGSFIVTWQSFDPDRGYSIYGQRYDSSGVVAGQELQVSTNTTTYQRFPSVAALNDSGFVVTWDSEEDGDSYGIYGQRYDSMGAVAGSKFQVNTYTISSQTSSSTAPLNNSGFVVTWSSSGQDGNGDGIYGQKYDSMGAAAGLEFQVNTYTTSSQTSPSIASLNNGGVVITWESNFQDGDLTGIYGQRYDSNGAAAGTEFQVNIYTTSYQRYPSVAALNDGGFVVTWDSFGQDGDLSGIFGQRFDASGNPIALQIGSSTNATAIPSSLPTPPSQSTSTSPILTKQSSMTGSKSAPSNSAPPTSELTSSMETPSTRTQSSQPTSLTSSPSKVPSSTPTIVTVENLVYEESYPILVNDQVVGTYTVSGGTGLVDSGNPNVIYFDFDPSFQPEEGQIITLFYVPEEEVALWESIEIEGESYECLEARGQVATNQGRSSYQMVFEDTECLAIAPTLLATALPLTVN